MRTRENSIGRINVRLWLAGLLTATLAACGTPTPPGSSTGTPAAPSNVTATPGPGVITITWHDNSNNETGFVIYRQATTRTAAALQPLAFTKLGEVGTNTTTYRDTNVNTTTTYQYSVAAKGAGGTSKQAPQQGGAVTPEPAGSAQQPASCTISQPSDTDSDGDGLSNTAEQAGWTIIVDLDGQGATDTRQATSDPNKPDTDNDGVCDRDESALKTDPTLADTDLDTLEDAAEVYQWGSSPINV
ncbi:MAG TPA: hypothetical protein VF171_00090, partial [Trueperaceae bacterium]